MARLVSYQYQGAIEILSNVGLCDGVMHDLLKVELWIGAMFCLFALDHRSDMVSIFYSFLKKKNISTFRHLTARVGEKADDYKIRFPYKFSLVVLF